MRNFLLFCGLSLGLPFFSLHGGTVVFLANEPEVNGKLTLTASGIHVDPASSTGDLALNSILAANFSDLPLTLDTFSVNPGDAGLPLTWKSQEIGTGGAPGTIACAGGEITLTGSGSESRDRKDADRFFFAGQPWTGNGVWTLRVKQIDDQAPLAAAGIMLRAGVGDETPFVSVAVSGSARGREPHVIFRTRDTEGRHTSDGNERQVSLQLPVWIRLTLSGLDASAEYSTDGKVWNPAGRQALKSWTGSWVGVFINSHAPNVTGRAVLDRVSFVPGPSASQVIPPGALLTSGSFLAGNFDLFKPDDGSEPRYTLMREVKSIPLSKDNVAVATLQPTARSLIAPLSARTGLLMKNGDFVDGDFEAINRDEVRVNSLLLGITPYRSTETRACLLHPMPAQPTAPYEVRLRDGSIIFANGLSVNRGRLTIGEVSGIDIPVEPDEIAQFRAGPAVAQDLLNLPWKASSLPAASAPPGATGTDVTASVPCWTGNNQEAVLVLPSGVAVDFPLSGQGRALAVSFALSPDSPGNAQADIRILADGREVGRTPPFRAGDPPRLVQVPLLQPKTLTFVADTTIANTRVLVIDPVAIK